MASSFDPASGFVQFSLGVAASEQFRRVLGATGAPFAVLAVGLLAAAAGGAYCGRTASKLAGTRAFTHPSQAVWLSVAYYAWLAATVVLLAVW
jgi:uncharacterized membrane protein YidH (DUF202 family)